MAAVVTRVADQTRDLVVVVEVRDGVEHFLREERFEEVPQASRGCLEGLPSGLGLASDDDGRVRHSVGCRVDRQRVVDIVDASDDIAKPEGARWTARE